MSLKIEFFTDRIIIHTHVSKTAGTTLLQAFYDLFGEDCVHDVRLKKPSNASALSESDRRNAVVLSGHFWFKSQERWFHRKPVYISTVRDPVERFLSLYRFVIGGKGGHPAYPRMAGKDFAQVVKEHIETNQPSISNALCRTFGVRKADDIPDLDSRYAVIAPISRIGDLVAKLGDVFGHSIETARKNIGTGPRVEIDNKTKDMILKENTMDVQLCDYVNERFDSWLAELEARLQR